MCAKPIPKKSWEVIKTSGLSRMNRNHIHMVTQDRKHQHRIGAEMWIRIDMQDRIYSSLISDDLI